jgi:hypothetical protein
MSACALRRFGSATPYTRPVDTPAAKELNDKLAQMRSERAKQDSMWLDVPEQTKQQIQPQPQQQQKYALFK